MADKPDGMNDRWGDKVIIIPVEKTAGTKLPDMEPGVIKEFSFSDEQLEDIRRHTLRGQCVEFREAVIDLCWLIARRMRLAEICRRLEKFLRRLKGESPGEPYGDLVSRYQVDTVHAHYLIGFMQKINAEEIEAVTFARGQLLLVNINVERPMTGKWTVELVTVELRFKVHSGKWTTAVNVMVPRWPAWRGYKIAEISGSPMLEHVEMQELLDYLAALQKLAKKSG